LCIRLINQEEDFDAVVTADRAHINFCHEAVGEALSELEI